MRINLDPRKEKITGYESPACLELLISLMVGRIDGDNIPPLKLYTFDDGKTFEIPYSRTSFSEGGHNRALSAFLLGGKYDFDVIRPRGPQDIFGIPYLKGVPLDSIVIHSDPKAFNYERNDPQKNYRDLPDPDEFFGKYQKINRALKNGTHEDYSFNQASYESFLRGEPNFREGHKKTKSEPLKEEREIIIL